MEIGKFLIIVGIVTTLAGIFLYFGGRIPHLPGDIVIKDEKYTLFFPIVTCLVISVALTILLRIFR